MKDLHTRKIATTGALLSLLTLTPSIAMEYCYQVPGHPSGTAEYSTKGKDLGYQAYANKTAAASCKFIKGTGKASIGNSVTDVYQCGGLTLSKRVTYRTCTSKERLGIPEDRSSSGRAEAALNAYVCSQGRPMSDEKWTIKDRAGKSFDLSHYEFMDETSQSCTPEQKTVTQKKAFRVGLSENYVYLVDTTVYPVKLIPQPSF